MRVLVYGGRDFGLLKRLPDNTWEPEGKKQFDWGMQWLRNRFRDYLMNPENGEWTLDLTIVEGGAKGADSIGASFAVVEWLGLDEYPADWDNYGKAAGHIRNQQMIDEGKPDLAIAFPGGKGTADMTRRLKKAGIPIEEAHP